MAWKFNPLNQKTNQTQRKHSCIVIKVLYRIYATEDSSLDGNQTKGYTTIAAKIQLISWSSLTLLLLNPDTLLRQAPRGTNQQARVSGTQINNSKPH